MQQSETRSALIESVEKKIPKSQKTGTDTDMEEYSESPAALCLSKPEQVKKEKTKEGRKFEFASKSESYDDVFEKTAPEYCEEIKRKRQDYRTKCRNQTTNIRLTSPKTRNEKKAYLLRQKSSISSQESPRRKVQRQRYSLRKEDSTVSSKTITLIRDNSFSLISIPYYLGSELSSTSETSLWTTSQSRPRLQIDLTKKVPEEDSSIKPKLQAICITLLMLTLTVTLIGLIIFLVS